MLKQERTRHKKKVSKVKLSIIVATSIAILVGGFFLWKMLPRDEITVSPIIDENNDSGYIIIGPIKDIIKETYVAGTPIKVTFAPVDIQGNYFYNEILGMQKVVELEYNVLVRWGYRGEVEEGTVKYYEKEKLLIIKEPQLTAFYAKNLVESYEDLGWVQSIISPTSYEEAKNYDKQVNKNIEQAIRDNMVTGREKVQDYLKEEINKLVEIGTIEVPIKEIVFEQSEEELSLINEELENLEIKQP